jgi:site-specific DNA recombinase
MNCVLYARVSTEKQAEKELSIPAQLQAMRDYAARHGWTVAEEFLEPGVSARTAERPELKRMLARCRGNDKPSVVLVHKVDRLARNVFDHATIRALLKQQDIRLASVVENVDDSVSGELVENIMASIAQFYSGNLSDEVKKGMRQKVLKGGWPHQPPRGYVLVRSDDGRSRVDVHPSGGAAIKLAFERYASGWFSLKALAALLAKDGIACGNGFPLGPSQVQRLLTNPFYAGRLHWRELRVEGAHPPVVSSELFDRVQQVLQKRFKFPGAKGSVRGFPLRGLAICATCRGHMTGGVHKRRFRYYRCARRGYSKALCSARSYCPVERTKEHIQRICRGLVLAPTTVESIRQRASALVHEKRQDVERQLTSLRSRRVRLAAKELRLTEAFVAEDLSPQSYKAASSKVRTELTRIDSNAERLQQSPSEVMRHVDELLGRAASVYHLHEELNETEQIELLRAIFQTVVLDETGIVGFTLNPPFGTIFEQASNASDDTSQVAQRISHDIVQHVTAMQKGTTP